MTRVAILWHMHQPYYEDLVTGEHILPWVRLHALKDYFGMVALLREFPEIRVTFNLVPSLLAQLEAFADGRARDRHLEAGLKPASELTDADAAFIADHFFHAQREHLIGAFPRYVELLQQRGGATSLRENYRSAGARFSRQDLLDLQVLHKLAWIDPLYHDSDPRVRALDAKGRDFTEDDKSILRRVELEILNRVIPEYRDAAARGQIELSTSPFYHPILPLLCDTDVYLRTHPHSRMPRLRFRHPEDAREQLKKAVEYHTQLFGRRPIGLWPSEGSVSDEMVPLATEGGFAWMATDELVLARSVAEDFARDAEGHPQRPELLYTPRNVRAGGAAIRCAFRDHVLSDLIGFTYAGWAAEAAADDFCRRLLEAGRRYAGRTGGEEATIPIILDGENAWENFPGGGRPFLRALYRRLSHTAELRAVTMSEACAGPSRDLDGIFPGSWIDANFYIWIGHADDHKAWTQLGEARTVIEASSAAVEPAALARAREEIFIAEGSDWFWWYGDDHSSAQDAAFDELFRRHLRNVYRLLNRPVPDELFISNISLPSRSTPQTEPSGLIAPTIDGQETSYFEWLAGGVLDGRETAGAMHQSGSDTVAIAQVLFGCDAARLYIRVDADRPMIDHVSEGREVAVRFVQPAGFTLAARQIQGRVVAGLRVPPGAPAGAPGGQEMMCAVGTVFEAAVTFEAIGVAPGGLVSFFVALADAAGMELERHPVNRPIEVRAPAPDFAARNWDA
jgi:alpha-amylase/alpha-mannosidase (GH57 family)